MTKVEQGFEGQYSIGSSIEIKQFVPSIYYAPLDNLIHQSTDNDPMNRPSIQQFADELSKWKELNRNFAKRSKTEWLDIQNNLFPSAMPRTVIWENIEDIISILNIISEHGQVNHTLFPGGGGLDLEGAKVSYEEGCIELNFNGHAHIVKPKQLIFECFQGHSDWNYFRLEAEGLGLIGNYDHIRDDEGLTEIEPCVYTDYECFEFDDFNGERLPASARPVIRTTKGSFLICLRTGIYNADPSTYDGRHNKINPTEFRNYIEGNIRNIEKRKGNGTEQGQSVVSQGKKPSFIRPTKIRKGSRILNTDEIHLLNKAIFLFRKAKKERNNLIKGVGLDSDVIDYFSEKTRNAWSNYDSAPKPHNDKFDHFWESLADDKLALIEAVMYGGRDAFTGGRAFPLDEMLKQLEKHSRDSRIYSITEKEPLDKYLLAGIKAYR